MSPGEWRAKWQLKLIFIFDFYLKNIPFKDLRDGSRIMDFPHTYLWLVIATEFGEKIRSE